MNCNYQAINFLDIFSEGHANLLDGDPDKRSFIQMGFHDVFVFLIEPGSKSCLSGLRTNFCKTASESVV